MYKGVMPFIALEVIALGLVMLAPSIALWLPEQLLTVRFD
jgi:TRAP-type mannitol/chloroaromatic compound transport system permease large subunit